MHKTKVSALIALFVIGLVTSAIPVSSYSSDGWTLVAERGVKAYPDLMETVWQKNASAPPHGSYDKIGLHRLVKVGIERRGVLLILPGTWSSGEQLISNPPEAPWTKYENYTHAIYWANRGFDVYSIDYRTHFVPNILIPAQLLFMKDWGWDQWISDIKEAVDKAKEVSGAKRIYMSGESFGGSAAMNYASKYWEEDLKGIILLDGGTGGKRGGETNTYNLTKAIEVMIATKTWSREVGAPAVGAVFLYKYALANPGAPAMFPPGNWLLPLINPRTGLPWTNITEYCAYSLYMSWGPGGVTNIYEGYGKPSVMIQIMSTFDRYWPTRLTLESTAISDHINCPYVTYDFDDHYIEIDNPLLAFASGLFANRTGLFRFVHGIANPDFTGIMLPRYGHLDVYSGEYSERDVSAPTYEWLISHRMLIGLGELRIDRKWYRGETTIYINATVIDFKVDGVRVAWNIVDHRTDEDLEFYKGEGELGWITILIYKEYAVAKGPKAFFLGYLV